MDGAVIGTVVTGVVALVVGIFAPMILVNLNRATAVKLLTEAAEKTGIENKRLNDQLVIARMWVLRLVNAIYKILPMPSNEDGDGMRELRELADQARVNI